MTQNSGPGHLVRVANRNKWVAAALAFLFGWMGAHKFYLGQFGMGIVYLLCSWTAIPLFISLVETIMLVVASEREFDVRFNSRLAR
jgi:TM2 domain-containing membrane protein YozV